MSEQEKMNNEEPIFMEPEEYLEYLEKQRKDKSDAQSTPIAQISMYQLNKSLVQSLKKMNNMAINEALAKVHDWYIRHMNEHPSSSYFALLNHEQHYFTIFTKDSHASFQESPLIAAKNFIASLKDILVNYYGDNDIRAIDVEPGDGAVEIWGMFDGEPSVAYLFPYDEGVVLY